MTATTLTPSTTPAPGALSAPSAWRRIANVSRLHLVNPGQLTVVPWLIMGAIFGMFVAVGWVLHATLQRDELQEATDAMQFNGALGYFLIYMLVLAVMAINQTFPFAQSYSVTRRDFYFGTALTFFGLSIAHSLAITVLGWLEDLTSGWGVHIVVFSPGYLGEDLAARFYLALVLFILFFSTGMATASVYVRWRVNGMLVFFAALLLLIVGLAALATLTESWPAIGAWIASAGLLGVVTWSLVPSALALVTGYAILRRATPRN